MGEQPPRLSHSELPGGSPQPRGNWAAVASLGFGALVCVPEVAGLLAIALGVIAFRRAHVPSRGGKRLAAAGVVLGALSVLGWSIGLAVGWATWAGNAAARDAARNLLMDFSHGDEAAVMRASTDSARPDQVRAVAEQLHPVGVVRDVQFKGAFFRLANGEPRWRLNGIATYAHGRAIFIVTIVHRRGAWLVEAFYVKPQFEGAPPEQNNITI